MALTNSVKEPVTACMVKYDNNYKYIQFLLFLYIERRVERGSDIHPILITSNVNIGHCFLLLNVFHIKDV